MALTPLGYEQITALTTAATLTVPTGATCAIVQAEAVDVRWRDDGTVPTASVGELLYALGFDLWIEGAARLAAFKAIRTAAGSIVNVSYYS